MGRLFSNSPARLPNGYAVVIALPLLLTAGASPEAATQRQQLRPYCTSDYLRLCGSSDTTRASVVSCFKRNIFSVSARCKRAIGEYTRYNPQKIERRRK